MHTCKKHSCQECGILLKWSEVVRFIDESGREHRVCIDCATEKYGVDNVKHICKKGVA